MKNISKFAPVFILFNLTQFQKTQTMKKALIAGLLGFSVLFVACGPKGEDADKKKADSIRIADSTAKVQAAADSAMKAQAAADSAAKAATADTTKKVEEKK
ncbi:MAG: hypothetical protein M0D57_20075 [Sphingobacteriales bacterium JAD_PAG50586_3]|nr:MAG: hypothetical protein M0D57_20075 [Sphingobacteriales bacterium JAD_PAG50586_3]